MTGEQRYETLSYHSCGAYNSNFHFPLLGSGTIFKYRHIINGRMPFFRSLERHFMHRIAIGFLFLSVLFGCATTPGDEQYVMRRLPGMSGPEDLLLDNLTGENARLLVSSDARLEPNGKGAIYAVSVSDDSIFELPRIGEPDGLSFHPHGIDLVEAEDGRNLLYVIVHGEEGPAAPHAVCIYEVQPDRLLFLELLTDPLLASPNDLAARPDGTIFVSNDSSEKGGFVELILRLRKSTVVWYDGKGEWKIAADRIAMANGIAVEGNTVYLAATRQDALFGFTDSGNGTLIDRRMIARVKGADNITKNGGTLLVASHPASLALARHMGNQKNPSPSLIFEIDPETGATETVFYSNGREISAASTAVKAGSYLYIGQIVEPFIVKVELQ